MNERISGERLLALLVVPATAAIAIAFAMVWVPSALVPGWVMPSGHDAVYHARRILDAIDAPMGVMQFDPRIHVPYGEWVPWPWGFDALLAAIAQLLRDVVGVRALTGLLFVPPAFLVVNAALVIAIARALRLPLLAQWLAGLCFAFSPLTQMLHGFGQIDHHFLELTCVLAALWLGLLWFERPERAPIAAALALTLGAANAVHNGLFMLQLPVVASLGLLWLREGGPPVRSAAAFAGTLGVTTLLVALPSVPFRDGVVRFDLLSWFHVHAALLTALAVLLTSGPERPDGARIARVAAVLAIAAAPLVREALVGLSFVSTGIFGDVRMPEMDGPFAGIIGQGKMDPRFTWLEYTGLVYLLPLGLAGAAVALLRRPSRRTMYLCIASLFGGVLMLQQYRLHQFGSFALYLLPLAWITHRFRGAREQRLALYGFAALGVITHAGGLSSSLVIPPAFGGSLEFSLSRALYPPLGEACAEAPGVVLADNNDGHYIRFLTECSVLGNNLFMSPQSFERIREANRLLALPAARLRDEAPWVRYVLVRRNDDISAATTAADVLALNAGLRRDLLLEEPPWPSGFRLIGEVTVRAGGVPLVFARAFEVVR